MSLALPLAAHPPSPWTQRALAALAVACVAAQFPGHLGLSAAALVLWLTALALADPTALRRVWRPRFFLVSAVLALLAGLFLGVADASVLGVPVSSTGVAAGALMIVRGGLILGLTTWLAQRLVARARRGRPGRGALGSAVATAVELMPELLTELAASWAARPRGHRLRALEEVGVNALVRAAGLADGLNARRDAPHAAPVAAPRWLAAVTGPRAAGKTTTLLALRDALVAAGWRVGGVVQPALGDDRAAYALEDLHSGQRRAFATRATAGGGFSFDPEAWAWAAERVRAARAECDVVIVDELGRVEAAGGGHLPALASPVANERAQVWVVGLREGASADVAAHLGQSPQLFVPANHGELVHLALAQLRARSPQGTPS